MNGTSEPHPRFGGHFLALSSRLSFGAVLFWGAQALGSAPGSVPTEPPVPLRVVFGAGFRALFINWWCHGGFRIELRNLPGSRQHLSEPRPAQHLLFSFIFAIIRVYFVAGLLPLLDSKFLDTANDLIISTSLPTSRMRGHFERDRDELQASGAPLSRPPPHSTA